MGGANRLVEVVAAVGAAIGLDCAGFFDKHRDSFFFLAAGGEEPSSTFENQPSGTKYGSSETLFHYRCDAWSDYKPVKVPPSLV